MKRYQRTVVFVSAYLALMLNDGLLVNIGVLFVDMMDTFHVTRTEGIVVQTVMIAITFASGIGSSFVYIGATSIVSECFSGKLSPTALSILSTSTRCAGIIFPYLLIYLSENLGLRGTFLICGGMLMNSVALAICWSPLRLNENKDDTITENEPDSTKPSKDFHTLSLKVKKYSGHTNYRMPRIDEHIDNVEQNHLSTSKTSTLVRNILNHSNHPTVTVHAKAEVNTFKTIQMLLNAVFVPYLISTTVDLQGILTFMLFVGDIYNDKGFGDNVLSRGMMVYNIVALFGGLITVFLTNMHRLGTFAAPILSKLCITVGLSVLYVADSYTLIIIASAATGLGFGLYGAYVSVTTTKLVGEKDSFFPVALGIQMSVASVSNLLSPGLGYIRDTTGSYNTSLLVMIGLLVFSFSILAMAQFIRWNKYKQTKHTITETND